MAKSIVKKVPHLIVYDDDTMLVQDVRLSYPHLRRPYSPGGKFNARGLMPKTNEYRQAIKCIHDEIDRFVRDNVGSRANPNPQIPDANKFFRDGDLKKDKPEYIGHWEVSAGESTPPFLRGRGRDPVTGGPEIIKEEDVNRIFYPGCWVNMLIKPWYQDHQTGGKKVNANLHAVQWVKDDEPFGEGRISGAEVDETLVPLDESGYDEDDEL